MEWSNFLYIHNELFVIQAFSQKRSFLSVAGDKNIVLSGEYDIFNINDIDYKREIFKEFPLVNSFRRLHTPYIRERMKDYIENFRPLKPLDQADRFDGFVDDRRLLIRLITFDNGRSELAYPSNGTHDDINLVGVGADNTELIQVVENSTGHNINALITRQQMKQMLSFLNNRETLAKMTSDIYSR